MVWCSFPPPTLLPAGSPPSSGSRNPLPPLRGKGRGATERAHTLLTHPVLSVMFIPSASIPLVRLHQMAWPRSKGDWEMWPLWALSRNSSRSEREARTLVASQPFPIPPKRTYRGRSKNQLETSPWDENVWEREMRGSCDSFGLANAPPSYTPYHPSPNITFEKLKKSEFYVCP